MHLKHTQRTPEFEISCDPAVFAGAGETRSPWYETESEVEAALAAGQEKALLLCWVRREMRRHLTPRERRFLEQHYFNAVAMEEVARRNGVHKTTVSRSLKRAVAKLRQAALNNGRTTPEDEAVIRAAKRRTW